MSFPRRLYLFRPWGPYGGGDMARHGATYDRVNDILTITGGTRSAIAPIYWNTRYYRLDGTPLTAWIITEFTNQTTPDKGVRNGHIVWIFTRGINQIFWYTLPPGLAGVPVAGINITGDLPYPDGDSNIYQDGYIFTVNLVAGMTYIRRWNAPNRVPGHSSVQAFIAPALAPDATGIGASDDGHIYILYRISTHDSHGNFTQRMIKYDLNLNVIHEWTSLEINDTDLLYKYSGGNFFVKDNLICFRMSFPVVPTDFVALVKINADYTLENYGVRLNGETSSQRFVISLGGCLGCDEIGIFSICDQQPIVWQSP